MIIEIINILGEEIRAREFGKRFWQVAQRERIGHAGPGCSMLHPYGQSKTA
jgi:hypothetical protein